MKKMKSWLMLLAIACTSVSLVSCDDDHWDGHDYWGWNDNDWNHGSDGSQDNTLVQEAQTLVGSWYGKVQLSEQTEDGNSRNNYEFEAKMIFYQNEGKANSLSGNGVEIDYATDGSGDQQTLEFSWYIDNNGDIYIKYTISQTTYVMDAGASQYGFHLGKEDNKQNDTFYGYMIGTGKAKGDLMYIDLERQNSSSAKALSRSVAGSATATFGTASVRTPIAGTINKLPARK